MKEYTIIYDTNSMNNVEYSFDAINNDIAANYASNKISSRPLLVRCDSNETESFSIIGNKSQFREIFSNRRSTIKCGDVLVTKDMIIYKGKKDGFSYVGNKKTLDYIWRYVRKNKEFYVGEKKYYYFPI